MVSTVVTVKKVFFLKKKQSETVNQKEEKHIH